jgi:hypothetical protein
MPKPYFTKKRLTAFAAVAIFYTGLWFITHQFGAAQVHAVVVKEMHSPTPYIETPPHRTNLFNGRFYWCSTHSYVPLIVYADYGWQGGPMYGDGGSALYLWFFGRVIRIRELDHWES